MPHFKEGNKMKKWLKKIRDNMNERLEKLAEENRKIYQGKRLDCCSINKKPVVKGRQY